MSPLGVILCRVSRETGDRATNNRRGYEAHRIRRYAQLQCIVDTQLFNEHGRPGERRADTAGQGDRTHHETGHGFHTKNRSSTDAHEVLEEDERGRQEQQDGERLAAEISVRISARRPIAAKKYSNSQSLTSRSKMTFRLKKK